ncbi:MAG: hypothetical protein IJI22_05450 [Bacilli bacterium]|nr:hypothetical protein [Bacilli bacterium]
MSNIRFYKSGGDFAHVEHKKKEIKFQKYMIYLNSKKSYFVNKDVIPAFSRDTIPSLISKQDDDVKTLVKKKK